MAKLYKIAYLKIFLRLEWWGGGERERKKKKASVYEQNRIGRGKFKLECFSILYWIGTF